MFQPLRSQISCETLAGLAASGEDADVLVHVGGHTFNAHSFILKSRSPYLKGMLNSRMREALSAEFTETEIDHVTFRAMLTYMYTDTVNAAVLKANAGSLFQVCPTLPDLLHKRTSVLPFVDMRAR